MVTKRKTSWLVGWFKTFWTKHGERLFFLGMSNVEAIMLFMIAQMDSFASKKDFIEGAAIGIIIGSMQLFYNKARGADNNGGTPKEIES